MDIEKVIQDLNRRFATPLPEYYRRRIIFWHDEDKEFVDKLDNLELAEAKLAVLTGSNSFAVKKLLTHDDTISNYLVYCPLSYQDQEDNWLLDIEKYSEQFRADLISIWMDEMGIASTASLREQVKHYREYFNAATRRAALTKQKKIPDTPAEIILAVMAGICNIGEAIPGKILRSTFQQGLDCSSNTGYQDFVKYGADKAFWKMAQQGTGYAEEEGDLGQLAIHMLLTASARTLPKECFHGLERFVSVPHEAYCYDFISEWLHSEDKRQLYEIARCAEEEADLRNRFSKMEIRDLADTECFPCIDEVILTKLLSDINDQIIDVDTISFIVEKRRTSPWYDGVENYYEGLLQIANMQTFFKEHSGGFHTALAKDIWQEYTGDYYKMDAFYRQFHLWFQRSLEDSNMLLDDLFKQAAEKVEGLYRYWFLGELGKNWTSICAEDFADYGKILEVPHQRDFYQTYIKPADTKMYVIISDALRYEVAESLADQLRRETQSQVSLDSMQASFPSITKFGMSALLPHKELTVELRNDQLAVLADGMSTAGTANRDKILKAANENSVALQYSDIIGMKKAERSALVKGMEVVYIYHDTIDEASHHSDTAVFPACDKAIAELKNMVRIITNEFGGTNLIITSDHGFLYTYSPLLEDAKVDKQSFDGMDVEYGRRYAIMKKGAKPDYLLPVKFLDGETYEGFVPGESIRIKMSGSGMNFVHGGISLQELVVPVISYHFLRNDSMEYRRNKQKYDTKPVTVNLLSASRKISNMIFNLSFYQKDAVGDNREAATYLAYFVDANGTKISDVQKIIADKANADGTERTFRCTFNLKALKYSNTASYYLMIENEQGRQMPQKEEFQIDIAFALDDFDFFS